MRIAPHSWYRRYGSAVVAVALAGLARWLLDGMLGDRFPFGMFYFAILFTAARHGLGPGLLAIALSGLTAAYLVFLPNADFWRPDPPAQLALVLYCIVSLAIAFVGQEMRAARQRAEALAREARAGQRQLEQTVAMQRRAELHHSLLAELGAHIRADQNVEDMLYRVAALVGERLQVSRVLFGDIDEARGTVTVHRDYVRGVASITGIHLLARTGSMREEARARKTMCCRDVRTDPRTAAFASGFACIETVAMLAVPLVRDGAWVAVLALHQATPRDWAPDEVELVETVAQRTWLVVENQRLTAETRRSEEQFRIMADTVPDILYIGDVDGRIEYVSQRVHDYTGVSPDDVLGHGWRMLIHPEDRPGHEMELARCLAAGLPLEVEFRQRTAEGSYRWFLCRARPVFDPAGRIVRWFGTNSDIDDRKRAEESLREANLRKDEFLATMAHELRNPLAPIRNAVELLKTVEPAEQRLTWARDVIERQIQQMARLVDDLLDISRVTRGHIELRRQRVELRDVVDSALELSRPFIDAAGHTLAIDLPAEPLPLDADPTRLAQVLANLLDNAAKYTEPGGHIWLSAAREDDRVHDRVIVRVRDSGIGISPEMLPHIFDVFTQAHAPLAHGGLGIGLTLVRRLVEMHGGTVEARSDGPGQGSELIVRLPLADAGEAGAPDQRAPLAEDASQPRQRRRILVVDDNRDSAESLAMLLEMRGNEVRMALDGRRAIEEATAFVPDVVLLDIGLPDMSGYDVARALRQEPALRDVVLIAQTGWGQDKDRRCSREAGIEHHLVKPIDLAVLQRLLGETRR